MYPTGTYGNKSDEEKASSGPPSPSAPHKENTKTFSHHLLLRRRSTRISITALVFLVMGVVVWVTVQIPIPDQDIPLATGIVTRGERPSYNASDPHRLCARDRRTVHLLALDTTQISRDFLQHDWIILEMFALEQPVKVIMGEADVFCNNSVLLVRKKSCVPPGYRPNHNAHVFDYLTKAQALGVRILGAVHFDDEFPDIERPCPYHEWYRQLPWVFRPFWSHRLHEDHPNTHWMPLGWKVGFGPIPQHLIRPASERRYLCSFVGTLRYPMREALYRALKTDGRCFLLGTPGFESSENLHVGQYRTLLLDTAISLAPSGMSRESHRIYESLEAGSIPVLDLSPKGYHDDGDPTSLAYIINSPLPTINDWNRDLSTLLDRLESPRLLNELQEQCRKWWTDIKRASKQNVQASVTAQILSH